MNYQLIAVVCAALGIGAAVLYFAILFQSLKLLREIRDRLADREPGRKDQ